MAVEPKSDILAIRLDTTHEPRGVIVVTLTGALNTFSSVQMMRVLEPELFTRFRHFVFDLADLTFIDSIGLSAMVTLFKRLDREGGTLRVARVSPAVRTVFEITKIIRKIPAAESVDAALHEIATLEGGGDAARP